METTKENIEIMIKLFLKVLHNTTNHIKVFNYQWKCIKEKQNNLNKQKGLYKTQIIIIIIIVIIKKNQNRKCLNVE